MQKHWDNPLEHPMPGEARVPAGFRIDHIEVAPATVLAPMVGVTDTVFRRFIRNASMFTAAEAEAVAEPSTVEKTITNRQSGCGLLMTEFTSADGLSRMRESKRKRYLTYYDDEHPISAQLFGSDPNTLADAARIVQDAGFDIVDLNLGCPAKRVVACNGGSGLLKDLPLIARIFEQVRAAVTIPFTVKIRMGWNDQNIVCVPLAKLAQESGLAAIALHARTREDGYSGQARWEYIAAVKAAVGIPVIGNGDIRTPEDAAAMVEQTGCDAVMIGRAAPANPWIFRQIAQYTATGSYDKPSEFDRYRMIRTYFEMLLEEIALEEAPQTPQTPRISAVSDAVIEASEVLSAEPVRHAAIAKARDRFAPPPSAASDDVAAEAAYEASEQGAITQPVPAIVGTGRSAPAVPEPLAADGAERAVPVNTTPNTVQKQKIVTVRVSARAETRWSGEMLLRALEANGLAYGRYQVFHRRHVDGRSLFCLASLIEPGTFDIERMPQEEFRGVTLFAVLPGPVEPLLTVDELFSAAQGLAEELAGVIQDAKGVPFSPQRIAAVRDDVARFQAAIATSRE